MPKTFCCVLIQDTKSRPRRSQLQGAIAALILIATLGTPAIARAQAVFVATGSLNDGRYDHAAVLLPDGRVLVLGGWGVVDGGYLLALSSSEIYDPATNTWALSGNLIQPRVSPEVAVLPSGQVLVVGGYGPIESGGYGALSTAEIYDPQTGTFSPTGSMLQARQAMTATPLEDGTVLVAGGLNEFFSALATAELYDPASGTFSPTSTLPQPVYNHAAVLLPTGAVLLAGGCSDYFGCPRLESILYEPVSGTFVSGPAMMVPRSNATATSLNDGRILVAGGFDASGEIYDTATSIFSFAGQMVELRMGHTATLLQSSRILFTGGDGPLASAEVFDLTTGFGATATMRNARTVHTATLLGDGRVLIAGGVGSFLPLQTAELYYESGYVDTVPPIISVPDDITTTAFDTNGILVFYTVSATDNVDLSPQVTCDPPSGSVFPVGTTTVDCVATDSANNSTTASFQVTVRPPLEIAISLNNRSFVDPITGQVTIAGTITCNRPANGSVYGDLMQTLANRAVVTAFFANSIACPAAGVSEWTATADATPSRFKPGKASVRLYMSACDANTCDQESRNGTINLTSQR